MCGRYLFTVEQVAEIQQIAESIDKKYHTGAWNSGEISPSMAAPVLMAGSGSIQPELLTWGYRGPKGLIINARAETAAERPMFRESVKQMRCVVPSSGFFEWSRDKHKYLFTLPGEGALYMAGLYDVRAGKPSYVILTTEANASMREVHHRMPLVLTKEQVIPWLTESELAGEFLRLTPPQLEKAPAVAQISFW